GSINTVSHYDGDRRVTLLSYTNTSRFADSARWPFALPLADDALILAEGYGEKQTVHLFDGKEHLRFQNIGQLVSKEAKRLRKLLSTTEPLPAGWGENLLFYLAKDSSGNIWVNLASWLEPINSRLRTMTLPLVRRL